MSVLELAVRQAEQRMMNSILDEIRVWVTQHAKDYILQYYTALVSHRNHQHQMHINYLHQSAATYHLRGVDPWTIEQAEIELKRGIDEDWRQSVRRYPEVLDYFYGLVDLNLPSDSAPQVADPPLDGGLRKLRGRAEIEAVDPPPLERRRSRRGRRLATRTPPPLAPSAPPPPVPRAPPPPMMPGVTHMPAPDTYVYNRPGW
ncbi:hypothetical protein FGG08_004067 [Glutinoglossum americanum]|uniref:Uncharacterized protein n=1 Tax=Glutinoglossum americanum TaxID=1670608 RepID=A0A9P8I1D0_9PEZI|nr:hypothetical protein FGG08_004067 [Glutinoglossum americanum]